MNREEILKMPAGREMDVTIGYHVMDVVGPPELYPEYSTDIEAAWKVVEWLDKRGLIQICNGDGDSWDARFLAYGILQPFQPPKSSFASAETMPLAICRAALLTVNDA